MIVRLMELPPAVNGFVVHSVEPDGDYDVIVINSLLPVEKRLQTLEHEQRHSELGHFYRDIPLEEKEKEARHA